MFILEVASEVRLSVKLPCQLAEGRESTHRESSDHPTRHLPRAQGRGFWAGFWALSLSWAELFSWPASLGPRYFHWDLTLPLVGPELLQWGLVVRLEERKQDRSNGLCSWVCDFG